MQDGSQTGRAGAWPELKLLVIGARSQRSLAGESRKGLEHLSAGEQPLEQKCATSPSSSHQSHRCQAPPRRSPISSTCSRAGRTRVLSGDAEMKIIQIYSFNSYLVVQVSPWLPGGRRWADGVRGGLHQHGDGRAAGLADHHPVHLPELGAHHHHLNRVNGGKKSSGCETCTAERCGNSGRQ